MKLRQATDKEQLQVLLYYCYTPIKNVEVFREQHHLFCIELGLRGRIIVATEGINGTVSGTKEACEAYMDFFKSDSRFAGIDFKVDTDTKHVFRKINVRIKPEIVHSGFAHINPNQKTGKHLSPSEFKKIKDEPNTVILDVRSNYEHRLGKFKNARTLDIENFRDMPHHAEELKKLKGKKVLTYCTGGIKCEKASAYLLELGIEDVYQLHGGIIKYGIEAGGEDFEGRCYVFDDRIAVDVNSVNPTTVSVCYHCQEPCERMINCANPSCNEHIALCETCAEQLAGACSELCAQAPDLRVYDGTGHYKRMSNGYNPLVGWKKTEQR
ncbi:MAG: rhodanese-related sulfurtransferase [Cytophagales bacterium]|nr:MAG: rhodanese-related sulfurtransferase [Cytophagales bacterium]TAF60666.1 MAG: rhodanese-related sulfurtransferase [Cytophagales bacterium]